VRNLRRPLGPVHKAAAVGAIAVMAAGMTGCGSSSPASGGAATTAASTAAPATTAPAAATTAPAAATTAAPTTTAPPTTVPASTTTTATTAPASTVPAGRDAKQAKRYKTIIDGANAAGTKFAPSLDGYRGGTVSVARFKSALSAYIAASDQLQTALAAERWPAPVEPLIHRIVTEDKRLVTQLKGIASTSRSKLDVAINRVTKTLVVIHTLSDQVRKDLGLPLAK
jgi:hypothetical protein